MDNAKEKAVVGESADATTDVTSGAHTIVALQTHYLNRPLLRMFRSLAVGMPGYTTCVLMHRPPGKPKPPELARVPHHFVTTPEIRDPAYVNKSNGPGWGIWRGGHTDLISLHFFKTHANYERYWFIEYDVRFSGAWRNLFEAFEDSDADFLSSSIRRASKDPRWMHWPTLHPPASISSLPPSERLCSFMPIFRISRRGMLAIDRAYREGWTGHCEAAWPTILYRAGCKLEDIGGDGEFVRVGNRNRFYTNTTSDRDLAPGSLVFRPVRWIPGLSRNRLWHPVKPLHHKLREDARRLWVMMKPYLPWVRNEPPLPPLTGWPEEATRGPSQRSP